MIRNHLVTTRELAERLEVDISTIHQWMRRHSLEPAHMVGGIYLWDLEGVLSWARLNDYPREGGGRPKG